MQYFGAPNWYSESERLNVLKNLISRREAELEEIKRSYELALLAASKSKAVNKSMKDKNDQERI